MRYNFNSLQEILPKLSGQKKVSNVCILKAATNEIKVTKFNLHQINWQNSASSIMSYKMPLYAYFLAQISNQEKCLRSKAISFRNY